ncbi:unnamed protein product, partial [Litomosoides sigmodontis]
EEAKTADGAKDEVKEGESQEKPDKTETPVKSR